MDRGWRATEPMRDPKPCESFNDRMEEVMRVCRALDRVRSDSEREALQREFVRKERLLH